MCLSAVYEVKDGKEKLVREHVTEIRVDGGDVILTDIMGEETVITGCLSVVDLVRNIVRVAS